jgi:hypothetical protein
MPANFSFIKRCKNLLTFANEHRITFNMFKIYKDIMLVLINVVFFKRFELWSRLGQSLSLANAGVRNRQV